MAIQRIKVAAICPAIPGDRKAHLEVCEQVLRRQLDGRSGIRSLAFSNDDVNGNGQSIALELDYDPRLITLADIQEEMKHIGFTLSPDRAQMVLGIDGMVSPRSEQVIEAVLSKLPGVAASASFASQSLRIEFDRRQCALPEIVRRLDELGFHLRPGGAKPQAAAAKITAREKIIRLWREYRKLNLAFTGGALLLAAFLVHKLGGERFNAAGGSG